MRNVYSIFEQLRFKLLSNRESKFRIRPSKQISDNVRSKIRGNTQKLRTSLLTRVPRCVLLLKKELPVTQRHYADDSITSLCAASVPTPPNSAVLSGTQRL